MKFSYPATVLWLVPVALQAVIAAVMVWRGLVRTFPLFFAYTVLVPSRDVILLLLLPNSGNTYSMVFWWGDAAAILLSLGVVVEILLHLFRPYPFLRFVFRGIWIVAIIATASALAMFKANNPKGDEALFQSIILMERSARILQVCLLIFLISLMSRLGLTWQHYSLGIAAGFGIYSALDLVLLQFRSHLNSVPEAAFALLGSAAYNLAVIIWAFYFLKVRTEGSVERLPSTDLANWDDALTEQVDKWYRR
jgi:hypothetical protein